MTTPFDNLLPFDHPHQPPRREAQEDAIARVLTAMATLELALRHVAQARRALQEAQRGLARHD